jgi:uncharacterized protein involved in response to NO
MPIPRLRPYRGPALFSYGFRPFFLFGAIYSGAAILLWLPVWFGEFTVPSVFGPRDWHVHEMLYGYVPAVITGFLLTAIPNWTGRLPLQGLPLAVLVLAWVAGRIAVTSSVVIGWAVAAVIDVSFLALVAAATTREIAVGRNWRNLKVVVILIVLALANTAFHIEAHIAGVADYSSRAGIAAVITLIMLIGGRIIPSFTRNWLVRENPGRLPAPFGTFDIGVIGTGAAALVIWIVLPDWIGTGPALMIAGLLQVIRMSRWAGERTGGERLVFILHVGYGFVALGFVLAALTSFALVPESAGIHAWTAGAVGTMTLAVMSRASLGHTGRELTATAATQMIYAAVFIAALVRVWAVLDPSRNTILLHVAAFCWAAGFLGFGAVYARILAGPRMAR